MHVIHNVCFPCAFQSLRFDFVTNSTISHLTSINSKNAHVNLFACKGIMIDNIHLQAPADSPNTDGIHIGTSSTIEISNSIIATGDDCVSMSPCSKNIHVRNVKVWAGPWNQCWKPWSLTMV